MKGCAQLQQFFPQAKQYTNDGKEELRIRKVRTEVQSVHRELKQLEQLEPSSANVPISGTKGWVGGSQRQRTEKFSAASQCTPLSSFLQSIMCLMAFASYRY